MDGSLSGERINKSLQIRDWTAANATIRDWEIAGTVVEKSPAAASAEDAVDAFIADVEAQHLADASVKKYRVLLSNRHKPEDLKKYSPSLVEFCEGAGIQFTTQITLAVLTRFRGQWKDGAISSAKKLERLRAFGRFLVDRGWWKENLALKLKRPKITDPPTLPFTQSEVKALLDACDCYTDWHGAVGQENALRLRAFLLFLRYSALRIRDATSCPADRLSGNRLFLYTQKTGVPVFIPLPGFVVTALAACPRKSERYWFWTGVGSKETLTGNWRRTFRRLCEIAGVQDGHPHRFRDTLAVELLLEGIPMERISVLLAHKSLKITERHYAPWVHARQAQLEADLARVWQNDPLVQAEILRGDAATDGTDVQMAATYSRHGKGAAPN